MNSRLRLSYTIRLGKPIITITFIQYGLHGKVRYARGHKNGWIISLEKKMYVRCDVSLRIDKIDDKS